MPKTMSNGKPNEVVADLRASIAKHIRMARAEKRLSQAEVASMAKTTPARVSELENIRCDPRLSTLVRIAAVLEVTLIVRSAS